MALKLQIKQEPIFRAPRKPLALLCLNLARLSANVEAKMFMLNNNNIDQRVVIERAKGEKGREEREEKSGVNVLILPTERGGELEIRTASWT